MAEDARALTSAVVCGAAVLSTGLGSAFHASAGGQLPGLTAIALISGLVWLLSRWSVGRRPSTARLAAAVALGQSFIHVALTATAGHAHASHGAAIGATSASSAASPITYAPGSLGDALAIDTVALDAATAGGHDPIALALHRITEELTLGHSAMALGHAAAGAVVGLWLAIGHRAFAVLTTFASTGLTTLTQRWFTSSTRAAVLTVPAADELAPACGDRTRTLTAQWRGSTAAVRGPPVPSHPMPNRDAVRLAA